MVGLILKGKDLIGFMESIKNGILYERLIIY